MRAADIESVKGVAVQLILTGVALDAGSGDFRANAFILDMNKVFEAFVYRGLLEALGVSESVFQRCHTGLTLDTGNQIGLEPDLSWWEIGQCRFIGDVKYKHLESDEVNHGDFYQMLAYLTATGLSHGTLIYAGSSAATSTFTYRGSGGRVVRRTLNIQAEPAVVIAHLGDVALGMRDQVRDSVPILGVISNKQR